MFVEHEFNEQWKLQAGLSYRASSLEGTASEATVLQADGRTLWRMRRHRDFSATDKSGRIELLGKFDTGPVTHNVLAGVDFYRFDDRRKQQRRSPSAANPYAIDIHNPVYGGQADPLLPIVDTRFRTRAVNRQSLSAVSPRMGLVYQPAPWLSLYASAARGFRPNSGVSVDNKGFPAEKSKSYEVGAKVDTPDGKITGALALFHITKQNVLTLNPANIDFPIPAGEMASKGLELDVSGEIAKDLRMAAAYAYTDAKATKGDTTITTGSRFPNVLRQSGSLVLTQAFKVNGQPATLGAA